MASPPARLPVAGDQRLGEPVAGEERLPELESVRWRRRDTEPSLTRTGRLWTLATIAQAVPLVAAAALLVALNPLTAPVAVILIVHAWAIPELYAAKGANVLRSRSASSERAQRTALGLLGDLLDHGPRALYADTGLVLEPGALGVWLLGEAGALLVRPGGRRVHCYCVKADDPDLPPADRVAHLLLALRTDERGFATVANLAFSGACWRLRRRLPAPARRALPVARSNARRSSSAARPAGA